MSAWGWVWLIVRVLIVLSGSVTLLVIAAALRSMTSPQQRGLRRTAKKP